MAPQTTLAAPGMPQPRQNIPTENIQRGKYSIITNTQITIMNSGSFGGRVDNIQSDRI